MEFHQASEFWPISSAKGQEKRAEAKMAKYPEYRAIWVTFGSDGNVLFQVDKFGNVASEVYIMEGDEIAQQMFLYWAFSIDS